MKTVAITEHVHPIVARRKELGMSASDLAKVSGCSWTYIWDLTEGRKDNPGIKFCVKLASALDVDLPTVASWFEEGTQ